MIPLEKTAQVWCICGNLGGGKTLTAVSMAICALKAGYFVVSNVTLNLEPLKMQYPYIEELYQKIIVSKEEYDEKGDLIKKEDFNPFLIPSGSPRGTKNGKRVLVILDECAEWFDQYSSAKNGIVKRVMSWLRHSSKRSQDVIFIVQRREYLQKNFRILVSRWINVDDLAVWRLPFLRLHVPFMGGFCMANTYDKIGTRVQPLIFISKSKWGQYYNTAECLSNYGGESKVYITPKQKEYIPWGFILTWLASIISLYW